MQTDIRSRLENVPVHKILPNPRQPRTVFSSEEMEGLVSSVRQYGVINPISLEEAGDGFILIDGERRWRAAKKAGLATIPAKIVPPTNSGGQESLIIALVANVQREDMNAVDEALALIILRGQGLSNTEIAHRLGKNTSWVAGRMALAEMGEEIQDLVREKMLPSDSSAIMALSNIRDPELRLKVARRLARPGQIIKVVKEMCGTVAKIERESRETNRPISAGYAVPMLAVAGKTALNTEKPSEHKSFLAKWHILALAGGVPPWPEIEMSARDTCRDCALYDVGSASTCRDCPGADLLKRLMEKTNAR